MTEFAAAAPAAIIEIPSFAIPRVPKSRAGAHPATTALWSASSVSWCAMNEPEFVTVAQAIDLLPEPVQPTRHAVYRWIKSGRLPAVRLCGRLFLRPADVRNLLVQVANRETPP